MRNCCKKVTKSLLGISTEDPYNKITFFIDTTTQIPIPLDATTKVRADETCRSLFRSSRVPFS